MAKTGIIRELWAFMRMRKKWWLIPIIVLLVFVGALLHLWWLTGCGVAVIAAALMAWFWPRPRKITPEGVEPADE